MRHSHLFALLIALVLAGCADEAVIKPTGGDTSRTDSSSSDTSSTTDTDTLGGVDTQPGVDTNPGIDTYLPEDTTGPTADSDGDGITDEAEGAATNRDSDGDGAPDAADDDSDNDGIADSVEAGDNNPLTPPRDSDGDGTPDFIDTDSDNNGVDDAIEGATDSDGDTTPDYRDFDNDGDDILDVEEILGGAADCNEDGNADPQGSGGQPHNCDTSTAPDYNNEDTDGDGILDRFERSADSDGDGFLDRYELDSDGDTLPDAAEGLDDTDGDGLANYRDPDSDDDGLTDDFEVANGTNPISADSDNDGSTDLIEFAAGTNPIDPNDNPLTLGDFVFTVPYQETPNPTRDTLQFRTAIRAVDLYFSFDTSTTMIQEMDALRQSTGVPAIINTLRCPETSTTCTTDDGCGTNQVCAPSGVCAEDPDLNGCLLDLWTGVGSWHHIDSFRNLLSVQPNPSATASAIPTAPNWFVAPTQAPACAANPANCTNSSTLGCASSGIGCPGFRADAVPIYVQITDANDECRCGTQQSGSCGAGGVPSRCSTYTTTFAGNALANAGIRFIGLIGSGTQFGDGTATSIASAIGVASGTVDSNGQPFIYSANDSAVVNSTVQAVRDILSNALFDITIEATDEPNDAGDALQFIDRLEVNMTGSGCTSGLNTSDTNSDAYDDAFNGVQPRTRVCWDVVVRQNTTVEPTREPQVFRARLAVFADGSEVDARTVYFLVPADVTLPPIN